VLRADTLRKGVGLVVPSLLTWPGSAIVHDIKGENWTLTAGYRARQGRVLLFDPTNSASSAYNPLLEVRRGELGNPRRPEHR
jgi:type IV secretion system protein VirD4